MGSPCWGAIFSGAGSYATPHTYTAGLVPGVWAGAADVAVAAAVAMALPASAARLRRFEAPAEPYPPTDAVGIA